MGSWRKHVSQSTQSDLRSKRSISLALVLHASQNNLKCSLTLSDILTRMAVAVSDTRSTGLAHCQVIVRSRHASGSTRQRRPLTTRLQLCFCNELANSGIALEFVC